MYPNPQDVLPLPPRPDLDQYRKRAKELAAACREGDETILAWATRWIAGLVRLQGAPDLIPARDVERRTHQVAAFALERLRRADCQLSQAQFVIARAHGFESWTRLLAHLGALDELGSGISSFERAADAIVTGDLASLERLLRDDPALVRARSDREHRATLLHYVAANGVENYRQRTSANIAAIARTLLDAGAAIDAEADLYGRGATTLALTVTSAHPRLAGVQNDLADLLMERGARLDPDIVRYALMNGCPEAAAHLAARGAKVDLTAAAGIGRLDVIRDRFEAGPVSATAAGDAMVMAAWYGQVEAVALLLELGVDPAVRGPIDGQTALHVAAYNGHAAMVDVLLEHGAPVELTDTNYRTTPLVWGLHGWLVDNKGDAADYRRILLALVAAGATATPKQIDDDRIRADAELDAALRGAVR